MHMHLHVEASSDKKNLTIEGNNNNKCKCPAYSMLSNSSIDRGQFIETSLNIRRLEVSILVTKTITKTKQKKIIHPVLQHFSYVQHTHSNNQLVVQFR